jgi:transcriptional regulator with XRE-family HTH domain
MSEDERAAWGPLITERRGQLDLTQGELADAAGVSEKTIYNIEAGGRTPQPRTLKRVQAALGLSTDIEVARERIRTFQQEAEQRTADREAEALAALETARANPSPSDWLRGKLNAAIRARHEDDPRALLGVVAALLKLMDESALRVAFEQVLDDPLAYPILRPRRLDVGPGLYLDESEDIATGEADIARDGRRSPGAHD